MRKVAIVVFFFLIAIVQTNLANEIKLLGVIPNFFIIAIVCFALLRDEYDEPLVGLVAGFIQDCASGMYIGRYILFGIGLGMIIKLFKRAFFRDNVFVAMVFVLLGTIVYESVMYFIFIFPINQSTFTYAYTNVIFAETLYNVLMTILIFPIVQRLDNWVEGR